MFKTQLITPNRKPNLQILNQFMKTSCYRLPFLSEGKEFISYAALFEITIYLTPLQRVYLIDIFTKLLLNFGLYCHQRNQIFCFTLYHCLHYFQINILMTSYIIIKYETYLKSICTLSYDICEVKYLLLVQAKSLPLTGIAQLKILMMFITFF